MFGLNCVLLVSIHDLPIHDENIISDCMKLTIIIIIIVFRIILSLSTIVSSLSEISSLSTQLSWDETICKLSNITPTQEKLFEGIVP